MKATSTAAWSGNYSSTRRFSFGRIMMIACLFLIGMGTTNSYGQTYCIPPQSLHANTSFYLNNVNTTGGLSDFTNTTGAETASYGDYSSTKIASQTQGLPITISATNVSSTGNYGMDYNVYVDYNDNGIFTDPGELVLQMGQEYTGTSSGSFTIPANAPPGTHKMRIRAEISYDLLGGGYPKDPCSQLQYGETEDYALTVKVPCIPPTIQATIGSYTNNNPGNNLTVNWARGNGDKVMVVGQLTGTVLSNPVSGTTYDANTIFGSGAKIGNGIFVVYNGTGTSVDVTGLIPGTSYTFTCYEYNSPEVCYETPGSALAVVAGVYCVPAQSKYDNAGTYISNFTTTGGITNFTNSTGSETASYGNYSTTKIASQAQGAPLNIFATSNQYGMAYRVYVDYNDNGVFTDPDESVLMMINNYYYQTNIVGSFNIPDNAPLGTHRMRVRAEVFTNGFPNGDPCAQLQQGETEDYALTVTASSGDYCVPGVSQTYNSGRDISNVTTTGGITNFTNATGSEPSSYGNYSATMIASQAQNSPITISATSPAGYGMYYNVYVDYNDNKVFTDPGELVLQMGQAGGGTISGSFTIPADAPLGTHRMRVRGDNNNGIYSTGPCDRLAAGETEDYGLTVTTGCTPPTTQATIGSFTNNTFGVSGITVNWTRGNGSDVVVVGRQTNSLLTDPSSGALYTANTTFGSGTEIGTGNFVVYNGTGTSVDVTGLTTGTSYTFSCYEYESGVLCYKNPGSAMTVIPGLYCKPPRVLYDNGGMHISNVTTAGGVINFTNNTGVETAYYGNYSSTQIAAQIQGSPITISATSTVFGTDYNVYVDYNDNGVFTDVGELVLQMATASPGTVSGSFTIPADAPLGTHRMRVRSEEYNAGYPTGPCSQTKYGETEDYGLTVDCILSPTITAGGSTILQKGGSVMLTSSPGASYLWSTGAITQSIMASSAGDYTVSVTNEKGCSATSEVTTISFAPPPTLNYAGVNALYTVGTAITSLIPTVTGTPLIGNGSFSSTIATLGSGFKTPYSVAVDAAGNVYVADYGNSAVKKLPAGHLTDGTTPVIIGSGFKNPSAVAVDGAGNVYVADYGNSVVQKIPAGHLTDGTSPITLGSGFTHPTGVAVDEAGNVYVADYGNSAVKVIPAGHLTDGTTPITIGSGFSFPWGIALDAAGNVYVADQGNNLVKEIPAAHLTDGTIPTTIGSGFNRAFGVAVDAAGNLYVANNGNNLVQEIPAGHLTDGTTPITIGSGFMNPFGVSVDIEGNVYVANYGNSAVNELKATIYSISPALPAGLSIDPTTGVISGTPTTATPATSYIITTQNAMGSTTATINFATTSPKLTLSGTSVCSGINSTTLTLSDYIGTVQWQSSTDNVTFNDITGETGTTYTASNLTVTTWFQAVVSNGGTSATIGSEAITVNESPSFTKDLPTTSYTITVNGSAPTLSVVATATTLNYQWYSNTSNSNLNGTAIMNATTPTYTPDVSATGTTYYYIIISGDCGSKISSVATVIVNAAEIPAVAGTISGEATVCSGANSTTLTLSDYTGTIQWQSSTDNLTFNDIANASVATYSATDLSVTTWYRVVVTSSSTTATSSAIAVAVNPTTAITADVYSPATVCAGGTAPNLSVSAIGTGTLHYQWYSNTTNSNSNGSLVGSDASAFTPDVSVAGTYYYYVVVSSDCGNATSAVAAVVVNPNTTITSDVSSPSAVCAGGTAPELSVTASGTGTLHYQWYSNTSNSNSNGSSVGTDASTFTPDVSVAGTFYYYVVVSSDCGNTTSSVATVVVNPNTTITSDVSSPSAVCAGGTAPELSVTATGTGTLHYQWYSNTTNSNGNGSSVGTDASVFTPDVSVAGTYYYYVDVSSDCSNTTSSVATVVVNPNTTITADVFSPSAVCAGGTAPELSVSATGTGTLHYQWYSNTTNSNSNGSSVGTDASAFTPDVSVAGTYYYYVDVSSDCSNTTSSVATVVVNPNTTITSDVSSPSAVCAGGTVTDLSVIATGTGTLHYQWYSNTTNSNSNGSLVGTDASAFTPDVSVAGTYYYYVIVSGDCGSKTSSVATVVVNPNTVITADVTSPAPVNAGGTAPDLNVTATGTGTLHYQWYTNSTNSSSNGSAIGTDASTFTPDVSTEGTYYYYVIVSGDCGSKTSGVATVTVNAVPMTYISSNSVQLNNGAVLSPLTTTNRILQVKVVTTGSVSPFNMTSMNFSTTGSTNPSTDIANAKVYYTGTSPVFASTTQFGSTFNNPTGSFTINGNQSLSTGTNYFWLTYDLQSKPDFGDAIDACFTQFVMSDGSTQTPATSCPAGNATINLDYCIPPQSVEYQSGHFYINNISTTGGITNFSSTPYSYYSSSYANYSASQIASQAQNSPITINLGYSSDYAVFGFDYIVYVDFNDNGVFTDPGEAIYGTKGSEEGTASATFTIPADAPPGTHRMRVRAEVLYRIYDECSQLQYGETDDYGLTVLAGCTPPTITKDVTSPATVCAGETAPDLSITASGTGTLHYQWYSNTTNSNSNGSTVGTDASTFTPDVSVAGTYYYYVVVSSDCGNATSAVAAVVVNPNTTITSDVSSPSAVCAGGTAPNLSVTATGTGTLHYQWYSNTTNSNSNGSPVGPDASTFTPDVSVAGTYYYYVVVSSDCGNTTSAVAAVVVNPNTTITSDVSSPSAVCAGGTAPNLSVSAIGTGTLHYQWYSNTTNSNSNGSLIGTDASTFTPDVSVAGTYYYYVVVSSDCGNTTSAVAAVVVNPNTTITSDVSSPSAVCAGGTAPNLSVSAIGTGTLHYQWYSNTTNSNSNGSPVGPDASAFTPDVSVAGTFYYYVVVSSDCSNTTSSVATIVVNPNTTITADISSPAVVCAGGTVTDLSVIAIGTGTLHYQWYSNTTNSKSNGSSVGTDASTFTPDVSVAGTYYYYVVVSSDCSNTTSSVATVVVNPNTTITSDVSSPSAVCAGGTVTDLSVIASGTGTLHYQWYSNTTNSNSNGSLVGTDASAFTPDVSVAGTYYYYVVVSSDCGTKTSSIATLIVNPNTTINTSPVNMSAAALGNALFTVVASGAGTLSYQWQVSTDGGDSFINLADNTSYSGTTGAELNVTGIAYSMNGYQYQCVVTGGCGTATSTAATLAVTKRPTVITYTGDFKEQYSDVQSLVAVLKDQETNTVLTSRPVTFTLGSQSVATTTDGTGTAKSNLTLYQDAGGYNVVSSFAGDDTYGASSDSDPFTITKENAITDYTGPEFISVPCATCATTQVLLSASVIDTSALYPADDLYPGDIRKARVKFINLDNMQDISGWLTPGLINGADTTSGIVSYNWTVGLPTSGYDVYSIGVVVDNNGSAGDYIGNDQSVLSVSRSSLTEFITGGGNVVATNSSGEYASDAGRKVRFGFNVKYNKSGKNLQGNMGIIFRKSGHVYQIKATSMTSLSINTSNPCSQAATFVSKANLTDITDENNPVSVYGGITLQITLTDNGEPGKYDMIGITLLNGNKLVYSSNWTSKKTSEMLLNGGNLVVKSAVVCSKTIATRNQAIMATEPADIPSAISLKAYPNPLRDQTTIVYTLPTTMHINLAVYDMMGKKVAQLKDATESAGNYTVKFNAPNKADGVYIYTLTARDANGKLTVINGKLIIGR